MAYAYVNPNATCPVCGATVYFYQNEFGSRVYFDDLGPTWPKHPCTDNADYYRGSRKSTSIIEPTIRDDNEVAFVAKYKWAPYRIEWCEKRGAEAILVLKGLIDGPVRRIFLRAPGIARRALAGSLVYYSRNRLSYFAPRRAKVVEIKVHRVGGAQRFIDTLLEFSRHSAKDT